MDVGCYPLSWLIGLLGAPSEVRCQARLASTGVDLSAAAVLRFPGGHVATAVCACDAPTPQMAMVAGPRGAIEVREPYRNRPGAAMLRYRGEEVQELPWQDDGCELYAREALAVAACADRQEHPDMPWDDSLAVARVLDACRAQAGVAWPA